MAKKVKVKIVNNLLFKYSKRPFGREDCYRGVRFRMEIDGVEYGKEEVFIKGHNDKMFIEAAFDNAKKRMVQVLEALGEIK